MWLCVDARRAAGKTAARCLHCLTPSSIRNRIKELQIMAIEIKAPSFPESVADGTISKWYKKEGDAVKRDEMLVDIETDKVVLEVLAEADGVMGAITKEEGAIVLSNEVLGTLNDGSTASAAPAPAAAAP
ncbi:Dihydrolipoamide succinyltransferase, partial [Pseudomonas syringae pv. coryli]